MQRSVSPLLFVVHFLTMSIVLHQEKFWNHPYAYGIEVVKKNDLEPFALLAIELSHP